MEPHRNPGIARDNPPPPDLDAVVRMQTTLKPGPLAFNFDAISNGGTVEWLLFREPPTLIVKATALTLQVARALAREGAVRLIATLSRGDFSCSPYPCEIVIGKRHTRFIGQSPIATAYFVVIVELHEVSSTAPAVKPPQ